MNENYFYNRFILSIVLNPGINVKSIILKDWIKINQTSPIPFTIYKGLCLFFKFIFEIFIDI